MKIPKKPTKKRNRLCVCQECGKSWKNVKRCPKCGGKVWIQRDLFTQDKITGKYTTEEIITDGFGLFVDRECPMCHHATMEVVRPRDIRCTNCGDK